MRKPSFTRSSSQGLTPNVDDATPHTKRISIFIGELAVLLAFCSLGGGNTTKDTNVANVSATNTWAFFHLRADFVAEVVLRRAPNSDSVASRGRQAETCNDGAARGC